MDSIRSHDAGPGFAEKVFTFFVLLLSTGAFMNVIVAAGEAPEEASGQVVFQALWWLIYIVAVVLIFRKCKDAIKELRHEYLLLALLLLVLASAKWSEAPGVSFRHGVALVFTCLFGVYLGSRFALREQLRLLAGACSTCVVFSFVFGILGIGNSVDTSDVPGWIGVFVQKNSLGRMMALSIVVFLLLASITQRKVRLWIGVGLASILLLLSQSMTSLVVLVAMLALFPIFRVLSRYKSQVFRAAFIFGAIMLAGLYWANDHFIDILQYLGKDITLTGRLPLWILSVVMALRNPWLGYGYNAFWLGPGSPGAQIWAVVHWQPPHAHNGLLEIWLELGVVGVGLFLLGFATYVVRAFIFLRRQASPEALWPICFLVFMFLSNLTESDFLRRGTITWIMYVAVVMTLRHPQRARRVCLDDRHKSATQLLAIPNQSERLEAETSA